MYEELFIVIIGGEHALLIGEPYGPRILTYHLGWAFG